jgi:hypothetical protein
LRAVSLGMPYFSANSLKTDCAQLKPFLKSCSAVVVEGSVIVGESLYLLVIDRFPGVSKEIAKDLVCQTLCREHIAIRFHV